MKDLIATALKYEKNKLWVLNQQKLPIVVEWIECNSIEHMADIIYKLQVRGAPLIGIAAAIALAHFAEQGATLTQLQQAANQLKSARPTAVNLAHCINRQLQVLANTQETLSIVAIAEQLFNEDNLLCNQIAKHGVTLLRQGDNILTHCNTGSLVTAGIGTALGIIHYSHQQNMQLHVFVDETRPLLQGAKLTAWELAQANIPYTLICDNMAASLMRAGKIDKIMVGSDRIARNGDFANKIGTYNLAVLAHYHNIPFYVAAPYTTVDYDCANGSEIVVEERAADEIRGAIGAFGQVTWTTDDCNVYNPSFDVTPANLVTAFILDRGIFKPDQIAKE